MQLKGPQTCCRSDQVERLSARVYLEAVGVISSFISCISSSGKAAAELSDGPRWVREQSFPNPSEPDG